MKEVKLLFENRENIITVNKSKFIGFAFVIKNKEDANKVLSDLKKKYSDATHICYAYKCFESVDFDNILTEEINALVTQSYSDDGEPTGTAGQPILSAINNTSINNVLVAVVRYFGGTKLGTAGLLKAYKEAATAVLDDNYMILTKCSAYNIITDYSGYAVLQRYSEENDIVTGDAEFGEKVSINIFILNEKADKHLKTLDGLIKIKAKLLGERYV